MFLWRLIRRLVKTIIYLAIVVVLIPAAGLGYGFLTTDPPGAAPLPGVADDLPPAALAAKARAEIPGYQRREAATFLAYPGWAAAHAAHEYAGFVRDRQPSGFPYWSYIGRYWQDCAMVIRAGSAYPFAAGDYGMLVATGIGLTIENAVQSAYENTIGRLTEWTAGGRRTAADDYQASAAADYAAFLDKAPWYDFPYAGRRAGLMGLAPAAGDDGTRAAERRLAFGLAYAIEQVCADLARPALAASSDPASSDIHVWARGPVGEAVRAEADTYLERDFAADGAIFVTARSKAFTDMIPRLLDKGISFVEIGGNGEILVTLVSPGELVVPEGARVLFAYALPADPAEHRTGLVVAVRRLHAVLPPLLQAGARLEQVYDY